MFDWAILWNWICARSGLMLWTLALSIASGVGSVWMVARLATGLPEDWLSNPGATSVGVRSTVRRALDNALGLALLLVGVAMLILPGQGVLTIFFGLMLLDFPGKTLLLRRLLGYAFLRRGINWIRQRRGAPPLRPPV